MCDICVFFVLKSTTLQFYYPINHVLLFFMLTLFIIDSRIRILLTLCIIILSYNPNPNPTNATVFEGDISLSLTRYKEEDNINYPKTFKTERGCPFLIKINKKESTYNN